MKPAELLYSFLASGPTPQADDALSIALRRAEPEHAVRIIETLLKRKNEAAWGGLIAFWDDLSVEIRALLLREPALMQEGIARALKRGGSSGRASALTAYDDTLFPRIAYMLTSLLRASSPRIGARAASILRRVAQRVLDHPPAHAADEETRRKYEADRRAIVQAASEAYRTYELHHRVEAIEIALWLAEELGDVLWQPLVRPRSRVGIVLIEHLDDWNTPRIAPFLLSALRQPNWQKDVADRLAAWSSPAEAIALLQRSELLESAEFRAALHRVKSPRWFTRMDKEFSEVPPHLRPHIQRWVMNAGFSDDEKVAFFARGTTLKDPELRFGMLWAMARFTRLQVAEFFRRAAHGQSLEASFARWYLSAVSAGLAGVLRRAFGDSLHDGETSEPNNRFTPTGEFSRFWYALTQTPTNIRHDLIEVIRYRLPQWRDEFAAKFCSHDPRDRIVAMQVVGRSDLAAEFAEPLRTLRNDPVEGIRQVAEAFCSSAALRPAAGPAGELMHAPLQAHALAGTQPCVAAPQAASADPADRSDAEASREAADPIAALGLSDEFAAARRALEALFAGAAPRSGIRGGSYGGPQREGRS